MCACVRMVICYLYTSRRVHGSCYCLSAKLPVRTKNLSSAQDYEWNPHSSETWQQLRQFRSDVAVQVSLYWSVRDPGVVEVIADPNILCFAIIESAMLAMDGPKMKSSITLGLPSMLRMKMTRNTSSS